MGSHISNPDVGFVIDFTAVVGSSGFVAMDTPMLRRYFRTWQTCCCLAFTVVFGTLLWDRADQLGCLLGLLAVLLLAVEHKLVSLAFLFSSVRFNSGGFLDGTVTCHLHIVGSMFIASGIIASKPSYAQGLRWLGSVLKLAADVMRFQESQLKIHIAVPGHS